jgi:hypothetical protein
MNAEGGDLYIGVADDGIIKGIDKDIEVLAAMDLGLDWGGWAP